MNSKRIGNITEAAVLAEFVKSGIPTLLPFGDNERYDMVVEIKKNFLKIQCKTGRLTKGVIAFSTRSSMVHANLGKQDYKGQIDFFAVYERTLNRLFLININHATSVEMHLRFEKSKNNQKIGVKYAEEYDFNTVLNELIK